MLVNLVIAVALMIAVGAVWFLLHYYGNPVVEDPQGIAKVSGNCGDTMEIGLQVRDNVVTATHGWTDGCSYSKLCVVAVAPCVSIVAPDTPPRRRVRDEVSLISAGMHPAGCVWAPRPRLRACPASSPPCRPGGCSRCRTCSACCGTRLAT